MTRFFCYEMIRENIQADLVTNFFMDKSKKVD